VRDEGGKPVINTDNGVLAEVLSRIDNRTSYNRVVKVSAAGYFAGWAETEEQLEQALGGLKEQCLELIGAGKKVLIQ
jgi:hypothetical protein